jgi:outer membrane murein-binding lipoprotein Lpp
MMRRIIIIFGLAATLSATLSGCIARAALDIVTLPVKAASAGVDALTTSQSEADEKRGRAIRKEEERRAREERKARHGKNVPQSEETGGSA